MESIYDRLNEFIEADETVAVATIIDVKGSVPREVGAKMIIHPLGRHVGTVGGGCGEADVIKAALDVIQTGEPATVRVDLTEDISMKTLGVCGGIMDVFELSRPLPSVLRPLSLLSSPPSAPANPWRWQP
jgi:xanthine/CO dehydrogenase XdhC/CoxF family maturation factor